MAKSGESKICYQLTIFNFGYTYSLIGSSGLGKTQYLKNIAFYSQGISVLYFSHESLELLNGINLKSKDNELTLKELVDFIKDKIKFHKMMVIFDEVFKTFDLKEVMSDFDQLQIFLKEKKCIGVLVDHRFQIPLKINISSIIYK